MKTVPSLICGSLLLMTAFAATAGDNALSKALKDRDGKTATLVLASGTELTGKVMVVSFLTTVATLLLEAAIDG